MDKYPFSTFALAVATVAQAAFVSWGITISVWLVLLWAGTGYIFFAEQISRNRLTKEWPLKFQILLGVVGFAIGAVVIVIPYSRTGIRIEQGNTTIDTDGDTWLRIKVTNSSPRDAKCRAYLLNLAKDGISRPVFEDDYLELWAANGGDRDFPQGFVMSAGAKRYFNVAAVLGKEKERNLMSIPSQEYYDLQRNPPLTPGDYKLTVEVDGPDCGPVSRTFSIRCTGAGDISFQSP